MPSYFGCRQQLILRTFFSRRIYLDCTSAIVYTVLDCNTLMGRERESFYTQFLNIPTAKHL